MAQETRLFRSLTDRKFAFDTSQFKHFVATHLCTLTRAPQSLTAWWNAVPLAQWYVWRSCIPFWTPCSVTLPCATQLKVRTVHISILSSTHPFVIIMVETQTFQPYGGSQGSVLFTIKSEITNSNKMQHSLCSWGSWQLMLWHFLLWLTTQARNMCLWNT